MASTATAPPVLYHLVQKPLWDTHKSQDKPYYPPTYDADGFTHLTKNPDLLLEVRVGYRERERERDSICEFISIIVHQSSVLEEEE